MTTIDTHTHAWGPDSDEYPWRAEVLPPGWQGAYRYDSLITDMDKAGVDEAVIVTTPLYGRDSTANDYTLAAVDAYPNRLWGVGLMEFFPDNPESIRDSFNRIVTHDRMLGVRLHAALRYEAIPTDVDRHGDWFLDVSLNPLFEEAADTDAAIFVFPKAQQLESVVELASTHPGVQFVIDHMAWPDETTAPDAEPWIDFEELAECGNVAVKVSSLPRSSDEGWPYRDLYGYVRNLIDWFGSDRLLLGSDYPWMDDWATYEECLSWLHAAEFLSKRDRAYLTHRTFERIHCA